MLRVREILRRHRRGAGTLIRVCAEGDLADGEIRRIAGLPVVLCRSGERLYALGLRCPHAGALLSRGTVVGGCLRCPLHGGRFALESGAVRAGPAHRGVPAYEVVVRDGSVYVSWRPRRPDRPAYRLWGAPR